MANQSPSKELWAKLGLGDLTILATDSDVTNAFKAGRITGAEAQKLLDGIRARTDGYCRSQGYDY